MKQREKGLSALQLTMMALGTVIGGSFFLGSSVAIEAAGPAILLSFIFGGLLVYFILYALSEMTVANPAVGSFHTFAARMFGPGAGFVVGWVYWVGMVAAMSSEATAISIMIRHWFSDISLPLLGCAVIAGVTLTNLLGADRLSKLESGLAAVKILTLLSFILIALLLVFGLFPGAGAVGAGALKEEPILPGGFKSLAGSMLIVMFSYAGFEIISLAATEAERPEKTIPRAIRYTVFSLTGLYILSVALLLPLIPTARLNENASPIVAALTGRGIGWAGSVINVVLITAILSTMLATMFGLGRMIRSLADEGLAPLWLRDRREVPYRGILFSGLAMLMALGVGLFLPRVYVFLISSGGFALLFTYCFIMATHIRFRKKQGCPPDGKCQMWGAPYTSAFVLLALLAAIGAMPFVPGQTPGLIAGGAAVVFFTACYWVMKVMKKSNKGKTRPWSKPKPGFSTEIAREFTDEDRPGKDKA